MIIPFIHDTPEWHALRAANVGGSEVSALFDCQPAYALSRYALWHVKAGLSGHPPVDNPRVAWGLRLEAAIAHAAAEKEGWAIRPGGYATDDTTPGLGASLDFVIEGDDPGVLEIKNVDWLVHRRSWTDAEPPLHILLQLQHQLAATGFTWGAVAALVGGNDLVVYRYTARPGVIANIRERVAAFWQSVREERPPPPDGSEGARHVLREMYPDLHDEIADLTEDNELPELCADLVRWTADRRAAQEAENELKARIMAKLTDHKKARAQGFFISVAVTPANDGRPAEPGEIIGKRAESRRLIVKEQAA